MQDYALRQMLMNDRIETLRRAAARPAKAAPRRIQGPDVELRLCKPTDDPALDDLAALSEQPVPAGRLVVALLDGRLVAALPVAGGCALRDPFVRTAHLMRLLELRAAQLREPVARPLVPRLLRRHA
ncbi:MAG TPA: hypothetical protein VFB25_04015 [Gaiellaceae bacterium]|nr:hypothetical protein [Gaiellaceae bacterium]